MLLWTIELENLAGDHYPPVRYEAVLEIGDRPRDGFALYMRRTYESVSTTVHIHKFTYSNPGASRIKSVARAVAMSQLWLEVVEATRADIEETIQRSENK